MKCSILDASTALLLLPLLASAAISRFDKAMLSSHNRFRAVHGVNPLVISQDLKKKAIKWAKELANRDKLLFSSYNYGQLIAVDSRSPGQIVSSWYNRGIKLYNYNKPGYQVGTGYFTQIIWKNTKRVGFGRAVNKGSGKTYIVAFYDPPGNYKSQFEKNVLKPIKDQKPPIIQKPQDFKKEMLERHNDLRKKHQAGQLAINPVLTYLAQAWANHLAKIKQLKHSSYGLGENIAWSQDENFSGTDAVTLWYDEIKKYNFDKPGFTAGTGHFTQVVWKSTTQVGFGRAVTSGYPKSVYIVAVYFPPGNINTPEYFKKNVLKPES